MIRGAIPGILLAASLGAGPALAQQPAGAAKPDSAPPAKVWTTTDTWLAAGFVVGIAATMPFDEKVAAWSQSPSQESHANSGTVKFFNSYGGEGVLLLSLGTYGVARIAGSRPWSELGLRATEAVVLSGGVTAVLKGVIGRQRPYVDINDSHYYVFGKGFGNDAYSSMPSGHTTAAFAFAASVTDEVHYYWPRNTWWVATLTYGSAAMVGLARIYSNAHWTSDVIAGAGVGTLSGLVVTRWHRVHPNSKLDRWLLPKSVAPAKNGISVTWSNSF
ncbi:MAG TPA: phosphatase PAP2 family protein [Dongiaceae bacterium]|nr:phosphatase PAP2 family protein [Dongiaceae bacterium]